MYLESYITSRMHLITSSIFLPSLCALISPVSRSRLLKTYLAVSCIWAVARGQPTLDVKGFIEATEPANLEHVDVAGAAHMDAQTSGQGYMWDKILEQARVHHDEHVTKILRSLAGWASAFETRRARLLLKKKPIDVRSKRMDGREHPPDSGPGLAVDAASANVESKNPGIEEDDLLSEDADLNPRAWREWKNGVLSSPTLRHSSHSHVRRMSDDADLSPRSWRDAVNKGDMDSPVRRALSECPRPSIETHDTKNEADYLPPTELSGSEYLDGSLFLRVAVLTLRRTGWDFETAETQSQQSEEWDFQGFSHT
jgi:hypothetical protein